MKRILIMTSAERRHQFMRMAISLADGLETVMSLCEGTEKSLAARTENTTSDIMKRHVEDRTQNEEQWFSDFCETNEDKSKPQFITKGNINDPNIINTAITAAPDLIICYGSSIIKEEWFKAFPGKILNLHLGLSPYYRGSGTNFWAMADGRFECIGGTFMIMDEGIDTGKILHQIRAHIEPNDTPHDIGNRLIRHAAQTYAEVIKNFDGSTPPESKEFSQTESILKKRADFTEEAIEKFYKDFETLRDTYLDEQSKQIDMTPIIQDQRIKDPS